MVVQAGERHKNSGSSDAATGRRSAQPVIKMPGEFPLADSGPPYLAVKNQQTSAGLVKSRMRRGPAVECFDDNSGQEAEADDQPGLINYIRPQCAPARTRRLSSSGMRPRIVNSPYSHAP